MKSKVKLEKCKDYKELNEKTGRIEVVRNNKLERVYFPIPNNCMEQNVSTQISFQDSRKKTIIYNVQRNTQQQKIEDFFKLSGFLMQEMDHEEEVKNHPLFSKLSSNSKSFSNISFFLAILINILCVSFYHVPPIPQPPTFDNVASEFTRNITEIISKNYTNAFTVNSGPILNTLPFIVIYILCLFQFLLSSLILFTQIISTWKTVILRSWTDNEEDNNEKQKDPPHDEDFELIKKGNVPKSFRGRVVSLYYLFTDGIILYRTLYFLFAFASIVLHNGPLLTVFHLFDVVIKSSLLKYVLKSVTENWLQLVLTAILAVVVVYIYSIIGFIFFRDSFVRDEGERICETLFMCLVTIVVCFF